ncbi:ATP-binding protein [Nonomuraea sp. NPDC000554]|uniref:ATP-binding protein n=1 Tax=Nonomuraea sp. NPDC000554 TaxID=3154259 RepID=UPI003329FE27
MTKPRSLIDEWRDVEMLSSRSNGPSSDAYAPTTIRGLDPRVVSSIDLRQTIGTEQAATRTRRASWALQPEVSSTPTARRLVRSQLGGWGCGEHCEVAELLVSELVTNALRHGSGGPVLTLTSADGTLRCEVEDESPAPVRTCPALGDDEGGRGLLLIDALSSSWGTGRTGRGKVVWFELDA